MRDVAVGLLAVVDGAIVIVNPWTFLRRDLYRGEIRTL